MLKTKKSRQTLMNIVFDGTLYIGIGVCIGVVLDSPIWGFMGVLACSMMSRLIKLFIDCVNDGSEEA